MNLHKRNLWDEKVKAEYDSIIKWLTDHQCDVDAFTFWEEAWTILHLYYSTKFCRIPGLLSTAHPVDILDYIASEHGEHVPWNITNNYPKSSAYKALRG